MTWVESEWAPVFTYWQREYRSSTCILFVARFSFPSLLQLHDDLPFSVKTVYCRLREARIYRNTLDVFTVIAGNKTRKVEPLDRSNP